MKRIAIVCSLMTSTLILPCTDALAGQCRDPWVTKAVTQVTGRQPSGSADIGDCDYRRYGGGRWTTYGDLLGKVRAAYAGNSPAPSLGQQLRAPAPPTSGLVSNNGGGIVANNGSRVIGEHGAGVIGQNGANLISPNGAGVIGQNGANLRR